MAAQDLELSQRRLPQSDQMFRDDSDNLGFLDAATDRRVQVLRRRVLALSALTCVSLVLSIAGLSYTGSIDRRGASTGGAEAGMSRVEASAPLGYTPLVKDKTVKRIAFGSCTSHLLDEQPIWTEGVIASGPDAWIWLGDMAYLDSPFADCGKGENRVNNTQCNCEADWLRTPGNCMAGDLDHAREKMRRQLLSRGYHSFLHYMCPSFLQAGVFPPTGTDPQVCPKPIIGTYDDHDYGWNNGNRRLPNKFDMKQIFLDAVGEVPDSPRRSTSQGIQWKYTFNEGKPDQLIDVYLLDERYERDTLPCHLRQEWCNNTVLKDQKSGYYAWCKDFVVDGGVKANGSCCPSDDRFFRGWCQQSDAKTDPIWPYLCDPTSDVYAASSAAEPSNLTFQDGKPLAFEVPDWDTASEVSPLCEVLGPRQRQWLSDSLAKSKAKLTIIGSGSVVFGNFLHQRKDNMGICSDDDWDVRCRLVFLLLKHVCFSVSQGKSNAVLSACHISIRFLSHCMLDQYGSV
eukprot:evm.model.scf_1038.4 EVM.evm.TU.scf_1038.4   scf_1038:28489-36391(-)